VDLKTDARLSAAAPELGALISRGALIADRSLRPGRTSGNRPDSGSEENNGGAEEGQPQEDNPCKKLNGVELRRPFQNGKISLTVGRQCYEVNGAGKARHDTGETRANSSNILPSRVAVS